MAILMLNLSLHGAPHSTLDAAKVVSRIASTISDSRLTPIFHGQAIGSVSALDQIDEVWIPFLVPKLETFQVAGEAANELGWNLGLKSRDENGRVCDTQMLVSLAERKLNSRYVGTARACFLVFQLGMLIFGLIAGTQIYWTTGAVIIATAIGLVILECLERRWALTTYFYMMSVEISYYILPVNHLQMDYATTICLSLCGGAVLLLLGGAWNRRIRKKLESKPDLYAAFLYHRAVVLLREAQER